jgi:beta-lactamase superfamily II metal-dependent hydrolase
MDVTTFYVGQGDLAVVRHNGEAVIIDSHFPDYLDGGQDAIEAKIALLLRNHRLSGLILTGFDSDHCHPDGVELILSKHQPDWVMYPKYYKETDCATEVFKIIERHVAKRNATARPLLRVSVRLGNSHARSVDNLSDQFSFELFSPHMDDVDHSNNSSVVLRMAGIGGDGFSYLVTGDTENDRWARISEVFGANLQSDVLSAAHHGSSSGAHAETILLVSPNTVLISAGVDSQYDHPHTQAVKAYARVAKHVFATNVEGGVSLFTRRKGDDFETLLTR